MCLNTGVIILNEEYSTLMPMGMKILKEDPSRKVTKNENHAWQNKRKEKGRHKKGDRGGVRGPTVLTAACDRAVR